MSKIQLIIGSTRPNRIGDQIAAWIKIIAQDHKEIELEIVDLLEWNLPFFNEPMSPSMSTAYTQDHTKKWSAKIAEGDGYIMLTPEYNQGYPASLKNAIDYLLPEWKEKPVIIASYGFGGGISASAQLNAVLKHVKMDILDPNISITLKRDLYNEQGRLKDTAADFAEYKEVTDAAFNALAIATKKQEVVAVA